MKLSESWIKIQEYFCETVFQVAVCKMAAVLYKPPCISYKHQVVCWVDNDKYSSITFTSCCVKVYATTHIKINTDS